MDITNAVMEGVDSLLLTGETAVGRYPVEAVQWLRRVATEYEDEVRIDRGVTANLTDRLALASCSLPRILALRSLFTRGVVGSLRPYLGIDLRCYVRGR